MLLLCLLLTGCSSGVGPTDNITVKWENGVITYKGTVLPVTEYHGYKAFIESGLGGEHYTFTIENVPDVTSISVNTQSVLEENMDKYKGKFYYSEYLDSRLTMAKDLGSDHWGICQMPLTVTAKDVGATYASDYLDTIPLTMGMLYVDFGSLVLGTEYDSVVVRPDGALITGIIKVSNGTYNCTTPVTLIQDKKEIPLMKASTNKYDYYMYDGLLIQIAAGLDPTTYIKFK